jgi:malate synthase
MGEILFETSDHSAGLNCGRWDYIFSFIKEFGRHTDSQNRTARSSYHSRWYGHGKGVEINADVRLRFLASWLGGTGCVPIYDVMENAATAEISRSKLWQWIRNGVRLTDGASVDLELVKNMVAKVSDRIRAEI